MIYLTTGANGAGKTLLTLKDVRDQQLAQNRPVYYHGFEAGDVLKGWGWLPFDPEKWQDLPDGSICIFDECQNEFPAKLPGALPDYINAIAQFRRKRGFDFWLICPHPSLLHINVRRLIENPSWHRHLKRAFGSDMVSVLKFNSPNMQCEKPSAGASGQVSMRAYPTEVYDWYKSAAIHTGKKSIPKQVYVIALALVLIPLLFWFAVKMVMAPKDVSKDASPSSKSSPQTSSGSVAVSPQQQAADYVDSFIPRVAGLPHTAPRYEEVTRPTSAPYPAACVQMGARCSCYTQQGTALHTTPEICAAVVKGGFYMDWSPPESGSPRSSNGSTVLANSAPAPSSSPVAAASSGGAPASPSGGQLVSR